MSGLRCFSSKAQREGRDSADSSAAREGPRGASLAYGQWSIPDERLAYRGYGLLRSGALFDVRTCREFDSPIREFPSLHKLARIRGGIRLYRKDLIFISPRVHQMLDDAGHSCGVML